MFTRIIAVFVAAVVLVTGSPVMAQPAQSSDLLASVERAALTTQVEQDQFVVRRRRSGGLAWTGGLLAAAGAVLALRPPVCELSGAREGEISETQTRWGSTLVYDSVQLRGRCTVQVNETLQIPSTFGGPRDFIGYAADGSVDYSLTPDGGITREAITNTTRNKIGWASVAVGGVLMIFGLRGVDTQARVDLMPTGGVRVSRSFGW